MQVQSSLPFCLIVSLWSGNSHRLCLINQNMHIIPFTIELLNIAIKNQIQKLRQEFKRNPDTNYFERLSEINERKFSDPYPYNSKIKLSLAEYIYNYADVFMFGSEDPKEKYIPKDLFLSLAYVLALMSFAPGGVKIFGYHWES